MSTNDNTSDTPLAFKPGEVTIVEAMPLATQLFEMIEKRVVEYMAAKREIDPSAMRDLIATNADVLASYKRKIERTVRHHLSAAKALKLFPAA